MSEPFIGEIRLVGFNFPPRGWAFCDGQLVAVNQNEALFSLLGTIYGGDGRTTFGLPDLRGRMALHQGTGAGLSNIRIGARSGSENVTLSVNNLPSHNHELNASTDRANAPGPGGNSLADPTRGNIYQTGAANTAMNSASLANAGGGQSFNSRNPYVGMYQCISLLGIYPSRN